MAKTTAIYIRTSDLTKQLWAQAAADMNMTLSEWIHNRCDVSEYTEDILPEDLKPLSSAGRTDSASLCIPGRSGKQALVGKVAGSIPAAATQYNRKHHPTCKCIQCKSV